jgi:AcrR family transcriptional regulator
MTRAQIAERAGTATGTVSFHFGSMGQVRESVIQNAIDTRKYLDVLAEGLSRRHHTAVKAPAELKRLSLDTLA